MTVQPLRFSGGFFPADPEQLSQSVTSFLETAASRRSVRDAVPLAIIAPHAGYRFSGQIAGFAYDTIRNHPAKTVVILSPSHRHAFDGISVPDWGGYQVGNSVAEIDNALRTELLKSGQVIVENAAHENEHGCETQLPFITGRKILPIVTGHTSPAQVSRVINTIHSRLGNDVLFVVSSDLSHFHDDAKAQVLDARAAEFIETFRPDLIDSKLACGHMPIRGFLGSDIAKVSHPVRLAMTNSGAITGDKSRVVGYGAWAFYHAGDEVINDVNRAVLLRAARQTLISYLRKGREPEVNLNSFVTPLQGHMASFVTLTKKGRLRGCIGSLAPHQPLILDVIRNAIKAGTKDPRFNPITSEAELADLRLKIAILTRPTPMTFTSQEDVLAQMRPNVSGMILQHENNRGTFLPMVWESLTTPEAFLNGLKVKAGLKPDFWADDVRISHYYAESFAEP